MAGEDGVMFYYNDIGIDHVMAFILGICFAGLVGLGLYAIVNWGGGQLLVCPTR